ncbi:hypothetical protein ACWGHD_29540 [Streptomyces xanthophaeus]
MDPVALASVVLPVTAVLYGVLAMRTFQERRWWPVAARRAAELVVDPYHAACGLWLLWDDAQAAAARLLLDGLVTVNRRGNLTLTEAGTDPRVLVGHPVPDSLLAALRRRTAPAPLGNVVLRDAAFRTVREDFHAACREHLRSRLPAQPGGTGRLATSAVWIGLAVIAGTAFAMIGTDPTGAVEGTAAIVTCCALVVQIGCLVRYGRLRDGTRREAHLAQGLTRQIPHPALAGLAAQDPEALARLQVSRRRIRRGRNHGRPRRSRRPAELTSPPAPS